MVVLRLGLSEIMGAVLILVISVVFGVALLTLFINYTHYSLQALYNGPLSPHCQFSVIGYAINKTTSGYVVALGLYNYGNAPCIIEGALVVNATTGNVITVVTYSNPIKFNGFTIIKLNVGSIKPPFIVRLYSRDGYVGGGLVG
ncbi:MAG: hypothetical protein RXQ97_01570 [Caldivirga sp.]|jgi:hypothetical protein|uniref:hypothetical protein n=1 Tax=Caldivirga sp. MU80 TaxID=1650354 RepID=UPI00082D34B3|nr:hypothetical protein [Caldivirga sp. MU80]